jgi:hypothetical protein
MYADFAFYLNDYQGQALTEAEFSRLSILAKAHIDRITHGRAATATGADLVAVKMAMCAVIDELDRQEHGGIVTAESNDGISRSYATGSVIKSATQRIDSAAEVYLYNTNLMFAGV